MAVAERSGSRISISGGRAVPNLCVHAVQVAARHETAASSVSRSVRSRSFCRVNVRKRSAQCSATALPRSFTCLQEPPAPRWPRRCSVPWPPARGRLAPCGAPAAREAPRTGPAPARLAGEPPRRAAAPRVQEARPRRARAVVERCCRRRRGRHERHRRRSGRLCAPSPGAYRRLTASAFRNSLRDLLQGPVTIGDIEPDSWSVGGLASVGAATVSISEAGVEQYQAAIDAAHQPGVRRRDPPEQAARLHPQERDRHGLLPVVRDQVRPAGLAPAAHVRSGHALRHRDRERRRDAGRRQRGDARRHAGPAPLPQLSLPPRARGGPAAAAPGSGSTAAARSPPVCRTS